MAFAVQIQYLYLLLLRHILDGEAHISIPAQKVPCLILTKAPKLSLWKKSHNSNEKNVSKQTFLRCLEL